MGKIHQAVFEKSSSKLEECPETTLLEYAFIGRSNVGKSSLINLLTGHKHLAKTSGKPGKTQLINHFLIDNNWYLVDLPGYGWAKVSKTSKAQWKKMTERYLLERQNLINVFLLIDSRHAPLKVDLDFMVWMGEAGVPFSIVFTKTDKQGATKTAANVTAYKNVLLETWEELPPIFTSSIVSNTGFEIIDYIGELNKAESGR